MIRYGLVKQVGPFAQPYPASYQAHHKEIISPYVQKMDGYPVNVSTYATKSIVDQPKATYFNREFRNYVKQIPGVSVQFGAGITPTQPNVDANPGITKMMENVQQQIETLYTVLDKAQMQGDVERITEIRDSISRLEDQVQKLDTIHDASSSVEKALDQVQQSLLQGVQERQSLGNQLSQLQNTYDINFAAFERELAQAAKQEKVDDIFNLQQQLARDHSEFKSDLANELQIISFQQSQLKGYIDTALTALQSVQNTVMENTQEMGSFVVSKNRQDINTLYEALVQLSSSTQPKEMTKEKATIDQLHSVLETSNAQGNVPLLLDTISKITPLIQNMEQTISEKLDTQRQRIEPDRKRKGEEIQRPTKRTGLSKQGQISELERKISLLQQSIVKAKGSKKKKLEGLLLKAELRLKELQK